MGNAIRFGIYRFFLIASILFIVTNSFSQDYYIDLKGDTQQIEISKWSFNLVYYQNENSINALFCDDVKSVYREQAEVTYKPYSSFVEELDYLDFLLPTMASLKELSTDYFQDEHVEVWMTRDYIVYQIKHPNYQNERDFFADYTGVTNPVAYSSKFQDTQLFSANDGELEAVSPGTIFIFKDSLGFSKIVSTDIEQDYYELLFSRYSSNPSLNDSIFSGDFKLKPKNFLDDFDRYVSPLTAVQFNDKDLANYYITRLKNGALVLLLNLDLKKVQLYRNAGNDKLADELERKLRNDNLSYAIGFLEKELFNFCEVYVTDASNRTAILNGLRKGVFLNAKLEIDSSITLKEDFFLFARKGQVFETQAINQNNQKKKAVTSTPVIQDAMIIYDHNNVQVMAPFPFYVREGSAFFSAKNIENNETNKSQVDVTNFKDLSAYLKKKYNVDDLVKSNLAVASTMNMNFYKFLKPNLKYRSGAFRQLQWSNMRIFENDSWINRPDNILFNSPWVPNNLPQLQNQIPNSSNF